AAGRKSYLQILHDHLRCPQRMAICGILVFYTIGYTSVTPFVNPIKSLIPTICPMYDLPREIFIKPFPETLRIIKPIILCKNLYCFFIQDMTINQNKCLLWFYYNLLYPCANSFHKLIIIFCPYSCSKMYFHPGFPSIVLVFSDCMNLDSLLNLFRK